MCWKSLAIKVVAIAVLLSLLNWGEGFQSKEEIRRKAQDLYNNKDVFVPNVKYGKVKNRIPWIDPVVFDDTYMMALKKEPTISDLETIFK